MLVVNRIQGAESCNMHDGEQQKQRHVQQEYAVAVTHQTKRTFATHITHVTLHQVHLHSKQRSGSVCRIRTYVKRSHALTWEWI